MRLRTEFFKNGDAMSIRTNADTEEKFLDSVAEMLGQMVEQKRFEHDWEFQFLHWLPSIVDIACKLRGYKANVQEERVITAGSVLPSDRDRIAVTDDELAYEQHLQEQREAAVTASGGTPDESF